MANDFRMERTYEWESYFYNLIEVKNFHMDLLNTTCYKTLRVNKKPPVDAYPNLGQFTRNYLLKVILLVY